MISVALVMRRERRWGWVELSVSMDGLNVQPDAVANPEPNAIAHSRSHAVAHTQVRFKRLQLGALFYKL